VPTARYKAERARQGAKNKTADVAHCLATPGRVNAPSPKLQSSWKMRRYTPDWTDGNRMVNLGSGLARTLPVD
jgi:hypothetical protein